MPSQILYPTDFNNRGRNHAFGHHVVLNETRFEQKIVL